MKPAWLLAAIILTLSITWMSSMPAGTMGGTGSPGEQIASNLLHIPAFALLSFLWIKAFGLESANRKGNKKALVWLLLALACFGALDEVHQSFVPGRFPSFMDFSLNLLGILAGWWGAGRVHGLGRAS